MSDQDNLLRQSSQNSSEGEDRFLNPPDQEEEPMEASGTAFGVLKPPSAFRGIDLLYGENPHKPQIREVSTPPHQGDPGVSAQMLE